MKAVALLAAAVVLIAAQDSNPRGVVVDPCAGDDGRSPAKDFAQRCLYRADNARLIAIRARIRVVFMGDSITEGWKRADPGFFPAGIVDRGISGQTTAQMLVRFRDDVIALKPAAVHIMAGTNDIAGNTGAVTLDVIEGNIRSMAELARAHGIKVIIASVPPAGSFNWRSGISPAPTIIALNKRLRAYALANRFGWIDYHAALADPNGGMKPGMAADGVHPTKAGYAAMRPLALAALAKR